jgi:hypothetical protein
MNNERRGIRGGTLLGVLVAVWATTALLSLAIRTLHLLVWIAAAFAIAAALVAPRRAHSKSEKEEA